MTKAEKCLADAVQAGKVSAAFAENARARVQQLLDKGVSEAEAMTRAAQEIADAAARKQRQTALRIIAAERSVSQARGHPQGTAAGVAATFARDVHGVAGHSNVEARARAIEAIAHAELVHLLDAFRAKALGFTQDLPGLRRLVRALYGDTGDAAASGFGKAWSETTDKLVARFNAAGGNLPRRETWRLPQAWDRKLVKAAGQGEFTRFMRDALDAGDLRISDFDTGEALPADKAAEIIEAAWQSISTNGVSDLVPGQPGGVALANARAKPRAFEWTTAEAYLRFNDRFGGGDAAIFDNLTSHISGVSRDIAMMEILGPNPAHQARVLMDIARKDGAGDTAHRMLGHIWNQVSGASSVPGTEWAADLMRGVRAWLTSVQLGSATLSSVNDFSTLQLAAAWNGLEATGVIRRYLGLMNPANAADRAKAVRLGLIADGWTRMAIAATRHQTDVVGRDLPGRIADVVLRASGLNAHTQAGKWAFGMEFSGHLAERAGKTLDQLEPDMRRTFARYGVTAADWDLIRTAGVADLDGVRFILPDQLANGTAPPAGAAPEAVAAGAAQSAAMRQAASRYLEMVKTETDFAIIEPGAFERALALGSSRPGTLGGEFRRSAAQYKSFPIAMMTRHVMRGIDGIRGGDHGAYLATTAVSLTLLGALAMQLKAVAQGKDPRDMTTPGFWGAAFMQGGGAGILGDFLNSAVTRSDRGFYMTAIGGPTAGLVDDLVRLTGGNIQAVATDKDAHFGSELARFVQRNTPGTSLWYARLAVDRLMWNRLQEMLDPMAQRRWSRDERRALQEYDQRFFWTPGTPAPQRAPSAGAAIGITP